MDYRDQSHQFGGWDWIKTLHSISHYIQFQTNFNHENQIQSDLFDRSEFLWSKLLPNDFGSQNEAWHILIIHKPSIYHNIHNSKNFLHLIFSSLSNILLPFVLHRIHYEIKYKCKFIRLKLLMSILDTYDYITLVLMNCIHMSNTVGELVHFNPELKQWTINR